MTFTGAAIADFLEGELIGDKNVQIDSVAKIEEGKAGALSFLANPKYKKYLYTTESSIVLVNKDLKIEKTLKTTIIKVADAYQSFASLLELYHQARFNKEGISSKASIDATASLGKNVYIGDFVVIAANVKIGDNVKIYPNTYIDENVSIGENTLIRSGVNVYYDCIIGKNCIIHSGTVVGAEGFGFAPQKDGTYKKVPQVGNVILEDEVELGANTCIDRATMGSTVIKKGSKIDNLIQIAHNAEIGTNTVIAAQAGISGSSKIGDRCMIGGQVGISGHLSIANGTQIAAQSGIGGNVKKENTIIQGSPAFEIGPYKRSYVHFKQLPNMAQRIKDLEIEIQNLKQK